MGLRRDRIVEEQVGRLAEQHRPDGRPVEAPAVVVLPARVLLEDRPEAEPLPAQEHEVREEDARDRGVHGAVVGQEDIPEVVELVGPEDEGQAGEHREQHELLPGPPPERRHVPQRQTAREDGDGGGGDVRQAHEDERQQAQVEPADRHHPLRGVVGPDDQRREQADGAHEPRGEPELRQQ